MRKILIALSLLFAIGSNAQIVDSFKFATASSSDFVSEWNTTNTSAGSSTSTQVKLPLESSGVYSFNVDWGDGSDDDITTWNQAETTHTYSSSGTYTITISGTIEGWRFANTGDRNKLTEISNFGTLTHINTGRAYMGCNNMVITATDVPNTTGITDFNRYYENCDAMTEPPLHDTSSGTTFESFLISCNSLTTVPMFDTSSGTNFRTFVRACGNLTTLPLIDTSNGTVFVQFAEYSGLTSCPLLDLSSMTQGNLMFAFTNINTTDWSALVVNTELVNSNSSVNWHGGNATYSTGAAATARGVLTGSPNNWTITDGGIAP